METFDRSHYFLLTCLAISLGVAYFIIQPFLMALILAAVFAFLFQPVYRALLRVTGKRSFLSALITTIIALGLIVVPVVFLGAMISKEFLDVYQSLESGGASALIGTVKHATGQIPWLLSLIENLETNIDQYTREALGFLASNIGTVFSGLGKIAISLMVFLFALYFLLKDGWKLKDYLVSLSPFSEKENRMIVSRLALAVSATVKGNLIIGIIQGISTGFGLFIFGVPNPVLWGSVAAVVALIPGLGTALVIGPAVIFLFVAGNAASSLGLLVWGLTAVGLIDNFLGPKLVGKKMHMHELVVFLAVLGGLALFGPLGFILGPLAFSICVTFIDIYLSIKKTETYEIKSK